VALVDSNSRQRDAEKPAIDIRQAASQVKKLREAAVTVPAARTEGLSKGQGPASIPQSRSNGASGPRGSEMGKTVTETLKDKDKQRKAELTVPSGKPQPFAASNVKGRGLDLPSREPPKHEKLQRCCSCVAYSGLFLAVTLTFIGIGWLAYQLHEKAEAFDNVKSGTCYLRDEGFREDLQDHPSYTFQVGGKRITIPSSVNLRGHIWVEPVVNVATCWVHLTVPQEFGVQSGEALTALTFIDSQTLKNTVLNRPNCASVVQHLSNQNDGFNCMYGAFEELGVLAGLPMQADSKGFNVIAETLLATRQGFPFVVCSIAACLTVLVCIIKLFLMCCRKCRKGKAAARVETRDGRLPLEEANEPLLG
jgi:hypothetical protein